VPFHGFKHEEWTDPFPVYTALANVNIADSYHLGSIVLKLDRPFNDNIFMNPIKLKLYFNLESDESFMAAKWRLGPVKTTFRANIEGGEAYSFLDGKFYY
jgi:hypothetical protein